jgi:GT2 family glycosyltransferase
MDSAEGHVAVAVRVLRKWVDRSLVADEVIPEGGGPGSVTLAVVTYHSAPLIRDFVAALPAALAGVSDHELIIVDNASSDDTVELVRACAPQATVVALDHNGGYAAGVNAGVMASNPANPVLVLNPDVQLQPGSVRALLDALTLPGVGIAVPRMEHPNGGLCLSLRREPTLLRALGEALFGGRAGRCSVLGEVVVEPARYARPGSADWATGAAMLISRECLESVGEWDERFFLYSEETDFCLRARDLGFVLRFVPDAIVLHPGGDYHNQRLHRMLVWNKVRLYRRRHGATRTMAYRLLLLLGEAARATAGRKKHRAGIGVLLWPSSRPPEVATALRP